MISRMNAVVTATRRKGAAIIHAPSDRMEFYVEASACRRVKSISLIEPPPDLKHQDPPLPFDAKKNGCDTGETEIRGKWTSQHPGIEIDGQRDLIPDNGREVYRFLKHREIDWLLIMEGTPRCAFCIEPSPSSRWFGGESTWLLIRDLTDAIYHPALPSYVSHNEGTELAIGFIKKFWCPSMRSEDLLG